MKKAALLLSVLGMASLVRGAVTADVLFGDNYNRPNNTDVDASSTGMSGSLAPMVYVESFEGSGQPSSIQILSNQFNVAVGAGMSSLYLDHNFTDADILVADGFSVSLEVVSITNADDQANRFGGFGVGNTLAEAQAAQDSFDDDEPYRGVVGQADKGISDLYVDLALDQNVHIWNNGHIVNTINVGAAAGTIKADFLVSDFNAGSRVTAIIYFNGAAIDTQIFTWDHTGANYIGISGRTAGAGVFLDNLQIATVYEDKAHLPQPADGASSVDAETLVLRWNKGKDAGGNPNAAITKHYLYIAENEPNFINVLPITVDDMPDPVTHDPVSINGSDADKVFYWRVDESLNGSPTDPNTIVGYVWSFDTSTFPVIDDDPDLALVPAGQTVVFECAFHSVTAPTTTWFKAGNPDEEIEADGDISIALTELGDEAYRSTLTIDNVEIADQGAYYCRIENASGPDNAVSSAAANLGVRRTMGHWTLDRADLQGGLYLDSSDEGHHAEPNVVPPPAAFVDGADPTETHEGLDLTVEPLSGADAGRWNPYEFTGQMTLSLWCKWNGANNLYQGLITKRDFDNGNLTSWYWEMGPLGGMTFNAAGGPAMSLPSPALETGRWIHLAVTVGPDGGVLYINGEAVATNPATSLASTDAPILIGSNNRRSGVLVAPFDGVLDDVRIYNYAMSDTEVVDIYYDVLETPVCLNPEGLDLLFDVAGGGANGDQPDCLVNLADFAVFGRAWLNCGLYPPSECP